MKTPRRILKINNISGYEVNCLFNNGESRIIDFIELFRKWNVRSTDLEYPLLNSIDEFQKVTVENGTLSWPGITITNLNEVGINVKFPYEPDPIVLYENSKRDESAGLELGLLIKESRKELGLTQEELAEKSGTTKHYISRIENSRTGIELTTLKKIIEAGLGKQMKISIV